MDKKSIQIAIVHSLQNARDAIRAAVLTLGYAVCCEACDGDYFLKHATCPPPYLAIVQEDLPDMRGLQAVAEVAGGQPIGAIVIRDDDNGQPPEAPENVMVLAVLQPPIRVEELEAALPLAIWQFRQLHGLRMEVAELQQKSQNL
jgi:DNA-binding NarL/FixJ family response regulator